MSVAVRADHKKKTTPHTHAAAFSVTNSHSPINLKLPCAVAARRRRLLSLNTNQQVLFAFASCAQQKR